tara:strand:+ start:2567 stop:2905 length:339 start_codon:yes stop_codon:yes gene_type:complete
MDKLKDLELCKKIAEIEGFKAKINDIYRNGEVVHVIAKGYKKNENSSGYWDQVFNPLADKALCFDLMVKHKIEYMPDGGNRHGAFDIDNRLVYRDENPQRAILLAIVAKHDS